nr:WAS/WASL-interacting protein family member 2-like [Aegilops tauschii subsp. strangulata]
MAMLYPKNLSDASRALPRTLAILCLAPLHNGRPAYARLRALQQPRCSLPAASLRPPARWAAARLPKPGGLHRLLGAGRFLRLAPPSRRPPPAPSSATHARTRMLADEAPPLWLSSAPPSVRSSARSAGPPPRDRRARLRRARAPAWPAPPSPTAAASPGLAACRLRPAVRAGCGPVPIRTRCRFPRRLPPSRGSLTTAPTSSRAGWPCLPRGRLPPSRGSLTTAPAGSRAGRPCSPRGRLSARRPRQRAPAAPGFSRLLWPAPEEKKREAGCPTREEEEKSRAG